MSSTMMMMGHLALVGVQPQLADAARHHQADVALDLLVRLDGAERLLDHLLLRPGDLQRDVQGALVEPFDVFVQPEDLAGVDSQPFEDAVAVEQTVIVDADLGVRLVEQLAVDIDAGHAGPL